MEVSTNCHQLPTHGQDGLVFLCSSGFVTCFRLEKASRVMNVFFFDSRGMMGHEDLFPFLSEIQHVSRHRFRCLGDRLAGRRSNATNASTRGEGVTFCHRLQSRHRCLHDYVPFVPTQFVYTTNLAVTQSQVDLLGGESASGAVSAPAADLLGAMDRPVWHITTVED